MVKNNPTLLCAKKVFKEKKTIKGELKNALLNKISLNASSLAKLVGISVHRVKKYCKNHNIDLANYDFKSIENKVVIQPEKKKVRKKIILGEQKFVKIILEPPKNIKIKIDD